MSPHSKVMPIFNRFALFRALVLAGSVIVGVDGSAGAQQTCRTSTDDGRSAIDRFLTDSSTRGWRDTLGITAHRVDDLRQLPDSTDAGLCQRMDSTFAKLPLFYFRAGKYILATNFSTPVYSQVAPSPWQLPPVFVFNDSGERVTRRAAITPECAIAAVTVRDDPRVAEAERALTRLRGCGEMANPAVAARILRQRKSTDITELTRLQRFVQVSPRGGILDALLAVAEDTSASVEARVSAFAVLVGELRRDALVTYHDVSGVGGYPGPGGVPMANCGGGNSTDTGESQLTRADVDRIRRTAKKLRVDATQPTSVRSAAYCVW
jgi:hypothetical protein